jgi:hypothetical protein
MKGLGFFNLILQGLGWWGCRLLSRGSSITTCSSGPESGEMNTLQIECSTICWFPFRYRAYAYVKKAVRSWERVNRSIGQSVNLEASQEAKWKWQSGGL